MRWLFPRRLNYLLPLGAAVLLALVVACAKGEDAAPTPASPTSAATPAPATPTPTTAPATPPPSPAPSAPSATTAAPQQQAPATGIDKILAYPDGQPIVPGGPPFFPRKLAQETGIQLHFQYHQTKLKLWERAIYGGEFRAATPWNPVTSLNFLGVLSLARPTLGGMLLLIDMGRCSMVGRQDHFERCDGNYGNNYGVTILPGIFKSWEQPSPTTYVFRVREGVLWPAVPPMNRTDRTVTAEDIVWFLEITKKEGVLKDNFDLVTKFEAVDKATVRITLSEPQAEFLRKMSVTSMAIFPKECYDEKGCLGSKIVSPGPFLLKESIAREKVTLEKNLEFWLRGLPYIDRIQGVNIADVAAQKAAFLTRQTDWYQVYTPSAVDEIKKQMTDIQVHSSWTLAGNNVLRPQIDGPMADVRVRRAMAMTMDHKTMWAAGLEGHTAFPTLVSRDFFGADFYMTLEQAGENYQFNPDKAKALMKEAGYEKGFTIPIIMSSTVVGTGQYDMMLYAQSNWKKYLNIDVKITPVDATSFSNAQLQSTWQGFLHQSGWNITFWADGDLANQQFVKGQRVNLQKIDDPDFTSLYIKTRSEMDPAKRTALLWQSEELERSKVYVLRLATFATFYLWQPWELNGASHQVAWFSIINGPSWLSMHDVSKEPKR